MRVSFGDFVLDRERRQLLRGVEVVHLTPKTFDLLMLLVQERPRVVAKDEILRRLWPDTFVSENNLATLVTDLRSALGDSTRKPTFIRTVHGRGYAFAAGAVDQNDGEPRPRTGSSWKLIWQRTEIPLFSGDNVIGRPADDVIGVDAPSVSRQHARISVNGSQATVEDLGSKNGTWLGVTPVKSVVTLRDGDQLRLGSVVVTVRRRSGATTTATVDDQ